MYFDQYSFNGSCIKSQINMDIYLTLHPNISNNYYYKISQNLITLLDSWVSDLLPPTLREYFDMRFVHLQPGVPDLDAKQSLITVGFGLDENVLHFSRRVQTIADVFSAIGGLMGISMAICKILLAPLQLQLFRSSLLKKLFFVSSQVLEGGENNLQSLPTDSNKSIKIKPKGNIKSFNMQENDTNL